MPKSAITIACMDLRLKRALVEALTKMERSSVDVVVDGVGDVVVA